VDLFHDQDTNEYIEQGKQNQALEQAVLGELTENDILLLDHIGDDADQWQYHDIVTPVSDGSPQLSPQMLEVCEWPSDSEDTHRGCNELGYHANDPIGEPEETSSMLGDFSGATSLRYQVRNLDSICDLSDLRRFRCCVQRTQHVIQSLSAVRAARQGISFMLQHRACSTCSALA
jgi:hypothetical protein